MISSLADATVKISGLDTINLFAAAASIILAIVALALSVFFFVQSKKDAERSAASANEISASVERLEKLFGSLYSDTFSIMKDTVSDMRKHVWTVLPSTDSTEEGAARSAEEERELQAEQARLTEEIATVSSRLGVADTQIAELRAQLAPILSRGLAETQSRERSIQENDLPRYGQRIRSIISSRSKSHKPTSLDDLARLLKVDPAEIVSEVFRLGEQGVLTWEGGPTQISGEEPILYVPVAERRKSHVQEGDLLDNPAPRRS